MLNFKQTGSGCAVRKRGFSPALCTIVLMLMLSLFPTRPVEARGTQSRYQDYAAWDNEGGGCDGPYIYHGCLIMAQTKLLLQYGVADPDEFTSADMMNVLRDYGLITGNRAWMGAGWEEDLSAYSDGHMRYRGYIDCSEKSDAEIHTILMEAARANRVGILEMPGHYVVTDAARSRQKGQPWIMDSIACDHDAERMAMNSAPLDRNYSLSAIYGISLFEPGPRYQPEKNELKAMRYELAADGSVKLVMPLPDTDGISLAAYEMSRDPQNLRLNGGAEIDHEKRCATFTLDLDREDITNAPMLYLRPLLKRYGKRVEGPVTVIPSPATILRTSR